MNLRLLFAGGCVVACAIAVTMAVKQRQQISELRAEQLRLTAKTELAAQAENPVARNTQPTGLQSGPPLELLELRGEVTRLLGRQRELAAARRENEQLRAQLVTQRTNATGTTSLPPGYILKSKAQWKGFNSPDDTLQSFLWAAQNRDATNLMQTVTPEMAQQILQSGLSIDDFFKDLEAFPGMRIVGRTQESNGQVNLLVEIVPGIVPGTDKPGTIPIRLRQINGQWKMDMR